MDYHSNLHISTLLSLHENLRCIGFLKSFRPRTLAGQTNFCGNRYEDPKIAVWLRKISLSYDNTLTLYYIKDDRVLARLSRLLTANKLDTFKRWCEIYYGWRISAIPTLFGGVVIDITCIIINYY